MSHPFPRIFLNQRSNLPRLAGRSFFTTEPGSGVLGAEVKPASAAEQGLETHAAGTGPRLETGSPSLTWRQWDAESRQKHRSHASSPVTGPVHRTQLITTGNAFTSWLQGHGPTFSLAPGPGPSGQQTRPLHPSQYVLSAKRASTPARSLANQLSRLPGHHPGASDLLGTQCYAQRFHRHKLLNAFCHPDPSLSEDGQPEEWATKT